MAEAFAGFSCGGEHEPGGGGGRVVLGGRKDAGVGVGGEHDTGVPELVLDGLEVDTGGVGEAGGAMAEIVESDRRQPGAVGKFPEPLGDGVRAEGVPSRRVNT
jgi:hypothetical protein